MMLMLHMVLKVGLHAQKHFGGRAAGLVHRQLLAFIDGFLDVLDKTNKIRVDVRMENAVNCDIPSASRPMTYAQCTSR